MILHLVPEISPLDAFCDVAGVVGVVGIGDSRSWICFLNCFRSIISSKFIPFRPPVWYRNSVVQLKEPIVSKDIWLKSKVNISKDDKGCWRATNHVHLYFQNCTPSSFGKSGFCIWAVCTLRLWEMKKIIVKPRGCDISYQKLDLY